MSTYRGKGSCYIGDGVAIEAIAIPIQLEKKKEVAVMSTEKITEEAYRGIMKPFSHGIEREMLAIFAAANGKILDDHDKLVDGNPDDGDLDDARNAIENIDFSDMEASAGRIELVETAITSLQKIIDRHRSGDVQVHGRTMLRFQR